LLYSFEVLSVWWLLFCRLAAGHPVAKRDGLSLTGVLRIVIDRREICKKNHDVPATTCFEKPAMPDHALHWIKGTVLPGIPAANFRDGRARLARARMAISGTVLIIKRKESRRLGVGCSALLGLA